MSRRILFYIGKCRNRVTPLHYHRWKEVPWSQLARRSAAWVLRRLPSGAIISRGVQIVPHLELSSGSRARIRQTYCFMSSLSVNTCTISATAKQYFSFSASHTMRTFLPSKSWMAKFSFISLLYLRCKDTNYLRYFLKLLTIFICQLTIISVCFIISKIDLASNRYFCRETRLQRHTLTFRSKKSSLNRTLLCYLRWFVLHHTSSISHLTQFSGSGDCEATLRPWSKNEVNPATSSNKFQPVLFFGRHFCLFVCSNCYITLHAIQRLSNYFLFPKQNQEIF